MYIDCMSRFPLVTAALLAMVLVGCATSDYTRITDKIAAYEVQAIETRKRLDETKEASVKLSCYRTLVSLTSKQLEIARRVNPETNPAVRSKSITLEQARAEKASEVARLEKLLDQYTKERNALMQSLSAKPS